MVGYPDKWNRARRRMIKYQRALFLLPRIRGKTLLVKNFCEIDFAGIEIKTSLLWQLREFYDSTPKPNFHRPNN